MADRGSVRPLASIPGVTAGPVMVTGGAEDDDLDVVGHPDGFPA